MWKAVLKRIFAIIFFAFSAMAVTGVIAAVVSMLREAERLSKEPGAGGMDFLLFEPMFIAYFSIIGLICSGVSAGLCSYKLTRIISFILLILFFGIMLIAFPLWIMR